MKAESIAALPMYDFPELTAAHDALWTAIAERLVDAAIPTCRDPAPHRFLCALPRSRWRTVTGRESTQGRDRRFARAPVNPRLVRAGG
jgi:hypothetical protein